MPNTPTHWLVRKGCGDPGFLECHIAKYLYTICMPSLLVISTLENILSIAILSRRRMSKYSITLYLLFLAGSDITTSWAFALRTMLLNWRDIDILDLSRFNCKAHEWITFTAGGFSLWIQALLTLERALFTRHPFLARQKLTRRNTLILIMVTFVALSMFNGHLLFGFSYQDVNEDVNNGNGTSVVNSLPCSYSSLSYQHCYLFPWKYMLFLVLEIIPFIMIVACNVVIVATLRAQRRRIQPTTQLATSSRNTKIDVATKMMFILSAVFVCTTMPYCILLPILIRVDSGMDAKRFAQFQLVNAVVNILLLVNYSINFFLYCISGTNFRQEGLQMMAQMKTELFKLLRL